MYEYTSKFGKQTVGTLFRKGRKIINKISSRKSGNRFAITNDIFASVQKPKLSIAATESISLYLLPNVLQEFSRQNYNLIFFNRHSLGAYTYMESVFLNLAFIEEQKYSKKCTCNPSFF